MLRAGIDIGGTDIKAILTDTDFKIILRRKIPFLKEAPYQETVKQIAEFVFDMCSSVHMSKSASADMSTLSSVGIALPGILDAGRAVLNEACNLGWRNAPIKSEAQKYFTSIPVFLENDANAAVIAEYESGALKGCKNAVLLTLGTGVGSGIILDGKLFRGESGSSPELGHIVLFEDGELCACGKRGCMETLCSASFLAREGQKYLIDSSLPLIADRARAEGNISAKTVIDSAARGDAAAADIFARYVDSLCRALIYCDKFRPQAIALGGGVSLAGDFLFSAILKRLKELTGKNYNVVAAEFQNDAGALGAAMLYKYN